MKRLALIAAAAGILAAAAPAKLADLRWQRRVVLLFAPTTTDPRLAAQRHALDAAGGGLAERDISLVSVAGDRVEGAADSAATLRARYKAPPDRFAALLIGKDGHVAERQAEPFAPDALFGTIDAMPMRRDEMKSTR